MCAIIHKRIHLRADIAFQTVADKITADLKISDDDTVALLMNYTKWGKGCGAGEKKLDTFRLKNTADMLSVEPKQQNTVKDAIPIHHCVGDCLYGTPFSF